MNALPYQYFDQPIQSYRLINSKFPPIHLFDDVADVAEFEALYELQKLTNPRIQNELGNLNLLPRDEMPFGIAGCSYAIGPFTHINPDGSRFSNGDFGVLYLADEIETALAEVSYHQNRYWQKVEGLHFDRLIYRGLRCEFFSPQLSNACTLPLSDPIYDPDSYRNSQAFGAHLRQHGETGLQYHSVRRKEHTCWGLFTPRVVSSVIQSSHYEFIWDGEKISNASLLTAV